MNLLIFFSQIEPGDRWWTEWYSGKTKEPYSEHLLMADRDPSLFLWKFDFNHKVFNNFIDKINLLSNINNDEFCVILLNSCSVIGEIVSWETNKNDKLIKGLLRKLKNKQSHLVFFTDDCGGNLYNKGKESDEDWDYVMDSLKKHDISPEQITIIGPDKYVLKEDRDKLDNNGVNIYNFHRYSAYQGNSNLYSYRNFNTVVKCTKPFLRQKKYLCLNNCTREHRADIFTFLHQNNLMEDGYVSYGSGEINKLSVGIMTDEEREDIWCDFKNLKYKKKEIVDSFNLIPLILDKKKNKDLDCSEDLGTLINPSLYLNSYFNIVTETDFDLAWREINIVHVTEKTMKPILMLQPFIIVGPYKSLEVLRDYGFKTFHPFIDESYDKEIDPEKRMEAVKKEILNLCTKSTEELDTWYWKMYDILEHNYKHLSVLSKKQVTDFVKLLEKEWENLTK